MSFAEYHQLSATDLSDLLAALECVETADKSYRHGVPCGSRFRVSWRSPKDPRFIDCEPAGFEQQFSAKIETKGHQRKLVLRWNNTSNACLLALTSTADMNGVQHAVRYFDDANAEAACLFSGNRVTVKLTTLPLCADAVKHQVQTAMAKLKQKQFDYNAQEGRTLEERSDSIAVHKCPSRPCWTCMFALLFMLPSLIRRLMLEEITRFGRYQTHLMKRLLAWSPRFSRRTYDVWLVIISAVDIAYRIYQATSGDELPSQFNHACYVLAVLFPLDLLLAAKNISFEKVHAALRTGLDKITSKSYVFCFVAYALLYGAFFVTYSVAVVLFMALFMVAWLGHAFPLCAKWHHKKRTENFLEQRAKQARLARIVARQRK